MTLQHFLDKIRAGKAISFNETMAVISSNYDYHPCQFSNGLNESILVNPAGTNEGSCKIFAFAELHQLDKEQTLNLFGDYYRIEVLGNPNGNNHTNIRNFMRYGWKGIRFQDNALTAKLTVFWAPTKPKIIITRKWPAEVEERALALYDAQLNSTDKPFTADELKYALQTADAVLTTVTDKITADVLNVAGRRAKIIGQFGVGYDNIDLIAAKSQNITVTNTPHILTDCTADIAMLLLLMSARRASEGERLVRARLWHGWTPTQLLGQKVTGKTLGLVGFGRIAQAMAKKAHHGFDMNILFYTPSATAEQSVVDNLHATRCTSVEELLAQSDFVSLHCQGGPTTRHLINAERLRLMRPTAHLINTARGEVVDNKALVEALKVGWIAGAGLDVYEGEPAVYPELLELDNVSLLPHLGSATTETRVGMGNRVLANIAEFFADEEPQDRII